MENKDTDITTCSWAKEICMMINQPVTSRFVQYLLWGACGKYNSRKIQFKENGFQSTHTLQVQIKAKAKQSVQ